jgi:hypothetical protein
MVRLARSEKGTGARPRRGRRSMTLFETASETATSRRMSARSRVRTPPARADRDRHEVSNART